MAQAAVLQAKGVYSAPNPYSGVPEGALVKAENAVIRHGRIEPRRGQGFVLDNLGADISLASASNEGHHWGSQGTVVHFGTNSLCRVISGTGATNYAGTYAPVAPTELRMKFVEMAQNLYFNTSSGIYFLESITGTPAVAGVPKALDDYNLGFLIGQNSGDDGWMAPDTACAYRYVWGIKDSNGNVKLGAPSGRSIIRNRIDVPAGDVSRAANVVTVTTLETHRFQIGEVVQLLNTDSTFTAGSYTITGVTGNTFSYSHVAANASSAVTLQYAASRNSIATPRVPQGITTSHFVRIYRTEETESADIPPDDEMYLVKEMNPDSTEISNGVMNDFTDSTPSSQLGPPAYWNANDGDGLIAAKERPPFGKDMCVFDGRLWIFNTTDRHRFTLRLLGVGTPDGIQNNDTVTINGQAFTAKTGAYTPGSFEFKISTDYDSPARNIEITARSLVDTISYNSGSLGLSAFYISGEDDDPGVILIERNTLGLNAFTVYASRPESWGPSLTTGSSGAQTSTNDARPHGASYSDVGEPEAFPLLQWLPVAAKGVNVIRGLVFRDKLFVFCDNRKAYTITGPAPYRVDEIDAGALLVAPDTALVHNNQIFAFTDAGLGVLSDAGFRLVSRPLEDDLLDFMALGGGLFKLAAFGVSYEEEHQYQLWLPDNSGSGANIAFIYNSVENTWYTQRSNRTWGRVRSHDGLLYMGDSGVNKIRVERKSFDRVDYADELVAVTINSVTNSTTVVLASAASVTVGDVLVRGSTRALVTAVNGNTLTVAGNTVSFTTGAADLYKAFAVTLKYAPVAPGGPGPLKDFQDVTYHFREYNAYTLKATFDTETYVTEGTATLEPYASYDLVPGNGAQLFAGPPPNRNRRVEVTQNHVSAAQLRVGLRITEAWGMWSLQGFTVNYEMSGDGGRP